MVFTWWIVAFCAVDVQLETYDCEYRILLQQLLCYVDLPLDL